MGGFGMIAEVLMWGRAEQILNEVISTVEQWPDFAERAGVPADWTIQIQNHHRLSFPS